MAPSESDIDIEKLFAPLAPANASSVVLNEARQVLAHIHRPIDAELWGSDMIGALSGHQVGGDGGVMAELAASLVPAAERDGSAEALALLRILAAIGSPELQAAAADAAGRLAGRGVPDQDWAAVIGSPAVGQCWHYGDVGGRQESLTVSFGYGQAEHALSVLIDHGRGGKIKDAWVDDAEGLLDKTWLAADNDPLIVFEQIKPADARERLARALAAGEGPTKPDETDDLTAHRALLHARARYLAANAAGAAG